MIIVTHYNVIYACYNLNYKNLLRPAGTAMRSVPVPSLGKETAL